MFDVFYIGEKPELFPHEVGVQNIDEARKLSRTRFFWIVNYLSDYSDFNFLWEPAPWEARYTHAWPSQWQKDGGTYLVPKNNDDGIHYQKAIVPRTKHSKSWEIDDGLDIKGFDYTWHPDPAEPPYVYQFGTQHQKTGGPRYVVDGATDVKYVENITADVITGSAKVVYFIDHCDQNIERAVDSVTNSNLEIIKTRHSSNYLNTIRRIAKKAKDKHEYIWICSSVCDYSDFNFSWHPEQWQSRMIHVFASNEQKFGDTFFIHIPSVLEQMDIELLEWHNINFVDHISVPRWAIPKVKFSNDSLGDAVKKHEFNQSIIQFYKNNPAAEYPTISLWREKTKTIIPLSEDASTALVPRESKLYVNSQVYDYPYIDKNYKNIIDSQLQDIVFISYDETNAEENFDILSKKFPRAKRLHGIDGMVNAIKKAAELSDTPYYYVVFAKTQIHQNFNFNFVPDYMNMPCNYLFHGKNMSNDLEYGTLGVTMYNARLVHEARSWDIDFTTSFPVKVIPKLSALGYFATDPYRAWRTAFRECTKMQSKCIRGQVDVETEYRLHVWTTYAKGDFGDWVLSGANDGVKYADLVGNSLKELQKINDWEWLQRYFYLKYPSMQSHI